MPLQPGSAPSTQAPTDAFPTRVPGLGVYVCRAPLPPSARLGQQGCCAAASASRALYDAAGHYAQTCVCHSQSAYYRRLEDLLAVWKELSVCAGVPATILPSKLPLSVLTGDDLQAYIKWDWPKRRGMSVVRDKSALHPFVGNGRSTLWDTYTPRKLQDRVNGKNRIYAAFHRKQNMQFVPLVGTTLGRHGADVVAMSWGLAHPAAEKAFLLRGLNTVSPTTGKCSQQFLQLRSRFEYCNTTRLSLALCRAGGSHGLPASAPHYRANADLVEALEVALSSRRRS
eukprot:1001986-Rhodomonas_salina.1